MMWQPTDCHAHSTHSDGSMTVAEVVALAGAVGVRLPDEIIREKIEQTRGMGVYFTSMQLDRRQGRAMEIEAIIGRPLEIAQRAAVKTPFLKMLHYQLSACAVES